MNNEELKHYGVPGMKWGRRKNTAVTKSYNAYRKAAKDERKAKFKNFFKKETHLAGYENQQKAKRNEANIKRLGNIREKAAFKAIDAQAREAYNKKLTKTGDKAKAEKASMKVHAKAMSKDDHGRGLVGSLGDSETGNANTRYYKHMMATKGKKYAKSVEKMYNRKLNRQLVGSAVVLAGSVIASAVIDNYYK